MKLMAYVTVVETKAVSACKNDHVWKYFLKFYFVGCLKMIYVWDKGSEKGDAGGLNLEIKTIGMAHSIRK